MKRIFGGTKLVCKNIAVSNSRKEKLRHELKKNSMVKQLTRSRSTQLMN